MAAANGAVDPSDEHLVDREVVPVVVHRAPRYERMLLLGAGLGLVAALATTIASAFAESPGGPMSTGLSGSLVVFAVSALLFVGLGLLVAGVVVIVLSGTAARRLQAGSAQHDVTLVHDLRRPAGDEVPRWVRQAEELGRPREKD